MESHIDADYLDADKYDQYYGPYAQLPDWLIELLRERHSVMELACGTGRIAIPLSQRGLSVTGIDYSQPMLDFARKKAREAQVEIELTLSDFRDFDLGRTFGSILLLSNALWHVHKRSDFEALMQDVQRHIERNRDSVYIQKIACGDPCRHYAGRRGMYQACSLQ